MALFMLRALAFAYFLSGTANATLVLHSIRDAAKRNAVCMDDSPAGYYLYRNPSSSARWIVHLEGGELCTSAQLCQQRARSPSGSSKRWSCARPQPGEDDVAAVVSSDWRRNPNFLDWNRVSIPHCTGDLYLGQSPADTNNFNVSMTGHEVLMAVFRDLIDLHGMGQATHVLFGGSSTGSLGVIAHLDTVTTVLRQANPVVKVAGFMDYWLHIYPSFADKQVDPDLSVFSSRVWTMQKTLLLDVAKAYINPACQSGVSKNLPNFGGFECLDPTWAVKYLEKAALLILTPRWDTYELLTFAFGTQHYQCMINNYTLSAEERAYISEYGDYVYQKAQEVANLAPKASGASASVYLANCYTHVLINNKHLCQGVKKISAYQALMSFTNQALLATSAHNYTLLAKAPSGQYRVACSTGCMALPCLWARNVKRRSCSRPGNNASFDEQECNNPTSKPMAYRSSGVLVKFQVADAASRSAICLDGSEAAYYVCRNFSNTNWVISMAGGGFCQKKEECKERAKTSLGSTKSWTCTLPGKDKDGKLEKAQQPSSGNKVRNPKFHTWNRVYIRYCSGDLYLGRKSQAHQHPYDVNTLGFFIMDAIFEDLLAFHNLEDATKVLFGGSSAGGIGAVALMDFFNEKVNRLSGNKTDFYGFNDGGWFRTLRSYEEYRKEPTAIENYHQSIEGMGLTMLFSQHFNVFLPGQCTDNYPQDNLVQRWSCMLAEVSMPTVQTPIFTITQRWDTYDFYLKLRELYGCSARLGVLPEDVRPYIQYYGNFTEHKVSIFMQGKSGIFSPNCYKHTSFGFDPAVNPGPPCGAINGLTAYQALGNWLDALHAGKKNAGPASSFVDPSPTDTLELSCNAQCGSQLCVWATQLTGNDGEATCNQLDPSQQENYDVDTTGETCPSLLSGIPKGGGSSGRTPTDGGSSGPPGPQLCSHLVSMVVFVTVFFLWFF